MTPEQRNRIVLSQKDALRRNGYHPNALFWSNQAVQEIRFKNLAGIGIQRDDSLLDIGCGFGDFANYLLQNDLPVKYTGIDISGELIAEGKRQHHKLESFELIEADIFDYDPADKSFDYITLSGTLNRKFMGNQGTESAREYSLLLIKKMFDACKKGIAFNLLDARHEWTANRWDLQSFHPDEILVEIKKLTDKFQLVDDYLENDFTFYAWRNDSCK